jgi:hypothetical protein
LNSGDFSFAGTVDDILRLIGGSMAWKCLSLEVEVNVMDALWLKLSNDAVSAFRSREII